MAIEIKELHIKVKVNEEKRKDKSSESMNKTQLDMMKSDIVKECTNRVLEKIKEKEER